MDIATDFNAQARTNPVFQTAKTAVCLMANANIADASEIINNFGRKGNDSLQSMESPDILLGNSLVVETKYRTMCSLIEKSGYNVCVDLPCGYTPKALHLTNKGMRFIGLDLPIVVQEMEPIIKSLAKYPERISFFGVDATNFESVSLALKNETEPLCITTEGMMMYFNESEAESVISNIRNILEIHGGIWITPDPEFVIQFFGSFRSVFGDDSLEKLESTKATATSQSDVTNNLGNSFILNPADIVGSAKKAEHLLKSHGLKTEKINLAEYMPMLNIYRQLTQKQISNFKDAMRNCHYWIISLDDKREMQTDEKINYSTPSDVRYSLENKIFRVSLFGRLDSLTAPKLLTAWEKVQNTDTIEEIEIDCSELEYITSAGIRVLLILQENFKLGITLTNVSFRMEKMLAQKGFTKIFFQNPS